MIADVFDEERVVLLILPLKKQLFPMNTLALTRACSPRRMLAEDCRTSYILDRDGTIRRIEHIEVLGAIGNSFFQKLLSWLTNSWAINVTLSEPLSWSLKELKQTLIDCINGQGYVFDDELDNALYIDQTETAILAAANFAEVFKVFKLPPPDEALNVL